MRKLIVIVLMMVGTILLAQGRSGQQRGDQKSQLSSEQKSNLMVKKLTLALSLSEVQQKDIKNLIAENIVNREAQRAEMKTMSLKGTTPSSDERYSFKMKRLDQKIATKNKIEKILTPMQLEKWYNLKKERQGNYLRNHHDQSNRLRQSQGRWNRQGSSGKI